MVLSGLLYAGCQIKSCITEKAAVKAEIAERTMKIKEKDQAVEKEIDDMDDAALADFIRRGGGVLPKDKTGDSPAE